MGVEVCDWSSLLLVLRLLVLVLLARWSCDAVVAPQCWCRVCDSPAYKNPAHSRLQHACRRCCCASVQFASARNPPLPDLSPLPDLASVVLL